VLIATDVSDPVVYGCGGSGSGVRSDRHDIAIDGATSADRLERTSHSLEPAPFT
jgi:hypothetical protein